MYVVAAEACTVASGESPPDQARVAAERASRTELEASITAGYEAMARAVHRKPRDFADVAAGVNLSAVAHSYPDSVPERVPARYRPWPDGYATQCRVREMPAPGMVPLRPIFERPFPIAASTAPRAPGATECPMQAYRPPYPAPGGIPDVEPPVKPATDRGWLWAVAIIAAAVVAAS